MEICFESILLRLGKRKIITIISIQVLYYKRYQYCSKAEITLFVQVKWQNIEYNIGDHFNGSHFTVPYDGLFSFNAKAIQHSKKEGVFYFYVNGLEKSRVKAHNIDVTQGNVSLDKTLELKKNDKVHLGCSGDLFDMNKDTCFFEGKLILKDL